ncbi:MAG TPA: MarR family transcriptional regulator [Vineibacter sp.]|nr:MarR family transcriptional regulator [Vineibacter sp.]
MRLTPVMERYIVHWGEMGTRWGVNRSVAQIHALLYLSPQPIQADEIVETLQIARSNVSTSLRELETIGLVRREQVLGDRRDHFAAVKDNWQTLLAIVESRKAKEIDPTIAVLRECMAQADKDRDTPPEIKARIQSMLTFVETLDGWYGQVKSLPKSTLVALMKMGARVARFVHRG